MELKQDLFIIPVKENKFLVYSPLRSCGFSANLKAVDIIRRYLNNNFISEKEKEAKVWEYIKKLEKKSFKNPINKKININSDIVFILSQKCNLACNYCFAHETRSDEILSIDKLKTVIDYVLSMPNNDNIKISFLGGGEPTVTWDSLEWSINYINNAKNKKQKVKISITTNATLLTNDKIDFLKKNDVSLLISFDILPEIQNSQRKLLDSQIKTFDLVDEVIKKLANKGMSYRIRATITKNCVDLMTDMVLFVSHNYKNIKRLHFEPVTDTNDNDQEYYNKYLFNFFEAIKVGKNNGIEVYNSISNSLSRIKSRFCNGEFCVTPTGSIVSCHRISSENEKSYKFFNYGYINNEIHIDNNKLDKVLEFANYKIKDCETCFAKWHCAGTCIMEKSYFSEHQLLLKCDFTKKLLTKMLEEKICC